MTTLLKIIIWTAVFIFVSSGVLFLQHPRKNKTDVISPVEESISISTNQVRSDRVKNILSPPPLEIPIKLPGKITPPPAAAPSATTSVPESQANSLVPSAVEPNLPQLPPLDEEALLKAVVKIECPSEDGSGIYTGSGFVLKRDTVVTAAHLIMNSGSEKCTVIFPRERRPIYYLYAVTENIAEVKRRHDEEGIDVAVLTLPSLDTYPEGKAIFSSYPAPPYPVCNSPKMLGDKLLHFGYPSNYVDQNYLSRLEGEAVVNADIKGIKEQLSQDQTYTFKSPIFELTADEFKFHPYMVSRVASFYGDSGGLAFNATKQCIIGPHRGGTIGKASGENFSVFINLGWEKAKGLLR